MLQRLCFSFGLFSNLSLLIYTKFTFEKQELKKKEREKKDIWAESIKN